MIPLLEIFSTYDLELAKQAKNGILNGISAQALGGMGSRCAGSSTLTHDETRCPRSAPTVQSRCVRIEALVRIERVGTGFHPADQ
jgi:hypothetical protein